MARKRAAKAEDLDHELDELLGRIRANWKKTDAELAKAGGIAESTWHAWRKGTTSPKYLDLRAVARAAGLDLGLPTDGAHAWRGVQISGGKPEVIVKPETAEIVRLMERLPAEARMAVRDAVHAKLGELLADPLDADAGEPASRVRSRK